jgi:tRNA-dihydrouridine synthase
VLDLNMGCPVPKITGGGDGAGSALLCRPHVAEEMIRKTVAAVRIPVTVKMRIGYKDPSGAEAVELAKRAEGAGASAISVHGRTREQQYSGKADYAAIGKVKAAVKVPVFGNGDVRSGADAARMKQISGCDGIMLGRGALGNPWIYREVAEALNGAPPSSPSPSPRSGEGRGEEKWPGRAFEDKRRVLLMHLELEREHQGERIGLLQRRARRRRVQGPDVPGVEPRRDAGVDREVPGPGRHSRFSFISRRDTCMNDARSRPLDSSASPSLQP